MDETSRMSGSYRPPFRRGQPDGPGNYAGDAPFAEQTSYQPAQNNRYFNRGSHMIRGRGYRGNGRGGRGGYRNDFFQKQDRVDESNLYDLRDIENHFWRNEVSNSSSQLKSTFHGSKERPDELAYSLLFAGANPRWPRDRIVFAKSKLALLPEFTSKKAQHGEWETKRYSKSKRWAANSPGKAGVSDENDVSVSTNQSVADTVPQGDKVASGEVQNIDINEPGIDNYIASASNETGTPSFDVNNEKLDVSPELTQRSDQIEVQKPITRTHHPGRLDNNGENNKGGITEKPITECKQEDVHDVSVAANDLAENDAGIAPLSAPAPPRAHSSTASNARLKYTGIRLEEPHKDFASSSTFAPINRVKYTDIRKEETQNSSGPASHNMSDNRMKYTDVRLTPAQEFYEKKPVDSEQQPVLPAITPIDYVPSDPRPIAIFEERRIPGQRPSNTNTQFSFKGWFKVSHINILAPQSAELVRMLQQKWERRDRFGNVLPSKTRDLSAWNASMAAEWAVVKFEPLEGEDAPPVPQIEKVPGPEPEPEPRKSVDEARGVKELLTDLRLGDGKVKEHIGEGVSAMK
jgi:hypothetical protein